MPGWLLGTVGIEIAGDLARCRISEEATMTSLRIVRASPPNDGIQEVAQVAVDQASGGCQESR
jgi:hypothetical protein